jgi:hypothetical protein
LQPGSGPLQTAVKPEFHGSRLKGADNRKLPPAATLRVHDSAGRKKEDFAEWLELSFSLLIGETAARRFRSRQHRKLQAMLAGGIDDVDGLIPNTADNLRMPEPKRDLRFYSCRDF